MFDSGGRRFDRAQNSGRGVDREQYENYGRFGQPGRFIPDCPYRPNQKSSIESSMCERISSRRACGVISRNTADSSNVLANERMISYRLISALLGSLFIMRLSYHPLCLPRNPYFNLQAFV